MHIVEREQKISRAERELVAKLERAPTDEEIAEKSKLPMKQVREVRAAARAVASLDKPVGEDDSASFGDLFASDERTPDEQVEVELTERALHEAVAELSEREQQILKLRYGLERRRRPEVARGDRPHPRHHARARAPARGGGAAPPRRAARDRRDQGRLASSRQAELLGEREERLRVRRSSRAARAAASQSICSRQVRAISSTSLVVDLVLLQREELRREDVGDASSPSA